MLKQHQEFMTTTLALNKEIVKAQTTTDEFQTELDLEKKQAIQKEKDISEY